MFQGGRGEMGGFWGEGGAEGAEAFYGELRGLRVSKVGEFC